MLDLKIILGLKKVVNSMAYTMMNSFLNEGKKIINKDMVEPIGKLTHKLLKCKNLNLDDDSNFFLFENYYYYFKSLFDVLGYDFVFDKNLGVASIFDAEGDARMTADETRLFILLRLEFYEKKLQNEPIISIKVSDIVNRCLMYQFFKNTTDKKKINIVEGILNSFKENNLVKFASKDFCEETNIILCNTFGVVCGDEHIKELYDRIEKLGGGTDEE